MIATLPDALFMVVDTLLVLDNIYNRATVIASVEVPAGGRCRDAAARFEEAEGRIDLWLSRLESPSRMQPLAMDPVALPPSESPYAGRHRFATTSGRSRSTSPPATSSRRCSPAASTSRRRHHSSPIAICAPSTRRRTFTTCSSTISVLVGSSPEVLVRVEDGEVVVRPIAGTRPRGTTPEQDAAMEAELVADPKERAEHLMLVDLGRNDVGRVAEYGTVRLTTFMTIERYSHVMHLVSEVRGRLRAGVRRARRARGLLSRRHRERRAQGARHGDHRRDASRPAAAPTPARWAT